MYLITIFIVYLIYYKYIIQPISTNLIILGIGTIG